MIHIRPVSDLRNKFTEIENVVKEGSPVYLTKNGYGSMVVMERRILRLPIGRLTWHYPQPDILQLEFVLPAGCFATVLVRELVDLVSLGQTDSLCVF